MLQSFPSLTERSVAYGLLYGCKILEMDAGSGLCIEVNLARGYLYIVTSRRFRCVSCYISRQTFMMWEILRTFFFSCLRVVQIFDWLLGLCWVYI